MNYVTKLNFQKSRAQATAHDCDTCVTLPTTNALLHTLETPGFHEWAHDYTLLMLVTQELTLLKGVLFTRFLRGGGILFLLWIPHLISIPMKELRSAQLLLGSQY